MLLVVRGPDGQVLDFKLQSFSHVIPPGFAKQVRIPESGWLDVEGYVERGERGRYARKGSIELRVLDFKTFTAETPVEQLLK